MKWQTEVIMVILTTVFLGLLLYRLQDYLIIITN